MCVYHDIHTHKRVIMYSFLLISVLVHLLLISLTVVDV